MLSEAVGIHDGCRAGIANMSSIAAANMSSTAAAAATAVRAHYACTTHLYN